MTFKDWDGLTEMRQFSDFYAHAMQNPNQIRCPKCNTQLMTRFYTTFNMNQAGKAFLTCNNPACSFAKNAILIEATRRENT